MNKYLSKIGGGFSADCSSSPFLKPEKFQWRDGQSEVNVYMDRAIVNEIDNSKINFGWLLESPEVLKELGIYEYIYNNAETLKTKFLKIFTCDKTLVRKNSSFAYAYSDIMPWVKRENYKIYEKTKFCSIIASSQRKHPGHILRHEMLAKYPNIEHFGFGYPNQLSIEDSYIGFKDYFFSFCIENCRNPGYWGVKLTNALVCGTVPLYWGDPEIGEIFDTRGFIMIDENFDFNKITIEDYLSREKYIQKNFEIVSKLKTPEDYLYEKYFSKFI